ncbi:hypothetical protein CYLTODRAFT_459884 [Cylindrobasidium torrendii FP15055 ss-10]|uniref:Uncharacterized protein n=1 Tax=Cylindrobasidium torrendii FP15055 ss-10 TaxID=1314674 RepID=A0A0D7AT64_9AGAR|nr:hypothetical protein CYLTODRAFT_459884 [Cylindrobasidium torrendii FP15055 ss-10]
MVNSAEIARDRRLRDQLARLLNYAPELHESYAAAVGGWLEWIPDDADEGEAGEVFAARVHALKVENQTKANAQREWEARHVTALAKALEGSIEAAAAAASRSTPTPTSAPAAVILESDDDTSAPESLATVLNYLHDMVTIKALRCAVASGNITPEFFEAHCPVQPSAPSGLQDLVSALQRFALQGTTGGTATDDEQDSEQDEEEASEKDEPEASERDELDQDA